MGTPLKDELSIELHHQFTPNDQHYGTNSVALSPCECQ